MPLGQMSQSASKVLNTLHYTWIESSLPDAPNLLAIVCGPQTNLTLRRYRNFHQPDWMEKLICQTCVSRNHGGPIEAPMMALEHRSTMILRALRGVLNWSPIMSWDRPVVVILDNCFPFWSARISSLMFSDNDMQFPV